jgi:hypothetical protein
MARLSAGQLEGTWMRSPALAAFVLLLGVAACESKAVVSGPALLSLLYDIEIGTPREEVIHQVGTPADRLTIDETEFLFYYTDWVDTPKAIDRSPFAIVNGRVAGMGKTYGP